MQRMPPEDATFTRRERLLNELARLSSISDYFPFPLVATGLIGDDRFVVIYREDQDTWLSGRVYDQEELDRMFEGSSPEAIADAIVVNELVDPAGPGAIRRFPWERALTGLSEPVQWHGDLAGLVEKPLRYEPR